MNKFFKARIRINSESIIIVLGARIEEYVPEARFDCAQHLARTTNIFTQGESKILSKQQTSTKNTVP